MVESNQNHFTKHFDHQSFLPLILFILGVYIVYLFLLEKLSQGVLVLLFSFLIYLTNNLIVNYTKNTSLFNEYILDMAQIMTFAVTTITFGLVVFRTDGPILLAAILFYSVCLLLSLARNWILNLKNSIGFPIALNGLFFPILYYFYSFYLQETGISIFVFYYIIVGVLLISHINFLGYNAYEESYFEKLIRERNIQVKTDDVKDKENQKVREEHILEENLAFESLVQKYTKPVDKPKRKSFFKTLFNIKTKEEKEIDEENKFNSILENNTKDNKFISFLKNLTRQKKRKVDDDLGLEYM